jgi:uncharacterized protein (DUF849 family)
MDLIINFTPTGMIPTKAMTPHVPITVLEIVEEVHEAIEVGITMVHLHARDEQTGEPTYKAELYDKIISGIRKFSSDLVICVSLSGRTFSEFEKRAECLQLGEASINSPEMVQALCRAVRLRGIMAELEAFDSGMINYAKYLESKGLLEAPHYFNLIVGNIACAQADLLHIGVMIRDLPPNSIWSLGGVGDCQLMANAIAIAIGGGVRVGLEDNIWHDPDRNKLARNVELVSRVHNIAEANERSVMTSLKLRKLLNLQDGHGHYGRLYENNTGS